MRCGDIAEIKGRVLPHPNDINIATKVKRDACPKSKMIAHHALYGNRARIRGQPSIAVSQIISTVVEQCVAPRLGRKHQRKGRVPCDIEAFHLVHLKGNAHRLTSTPVNINWRFKPSKHAPDWQG